MHRLPLLILSLVLLPLILHAQPQGMLPPHETPGLETGEIVGTLFYIDKKGVKKPLGSHKVAIVVFQNNQRVLMLHKDTNEKGIFGFKNIFKNPAYSYALGVLYEGKPYLLGSLQLKKDESKRVVEFRVGEGSPHLMEGMPPVREKVSSPSTVSFMAPPSSTVAGSLSVPSVIAYPYQQIAVILVVLVLIFAGYFYFSEPKKSVVGESKESLLLALKTLRHSHEEKEISKAEYQKQEKRLLDLLQKYY